MRIEISQDVDSLSDLTKILTDNIDLKEGEKIDPSGWSIDQETFDICFYGDVKHHGKQDTMYIWLLMGPKANNNLPPRTMEYME